MYSSNHIYRKESLHNQESDTMILQKSVFLQLSTE